MTQQLITLKKPAAILFDLDGTLVDTILDLHQACNAMLAELERPDRSVDEIARFVGRGTHTLVHRCLTDDATGKEPEPGLFETALAAYLKHYTHINGKHAKVYSGVKEGLAALQTTGYPMAVVTNLRLVGQEGEVLTAYESARHYNAIVHGLPWQQAVEQALGHGGQAFALAA